MLLLVSGSPPLGLGVSGQFLKLAFALFGSGSFRPWRERFADIAITAAVPIVALLVECDVIASRSIVRIQRAEDDDSHDEHGGEDAEHKPRLRGLGVKVASAMFADDGGVLNFFCAE